VGVPTSDPTARGSRFNATFAKLLWPLFTLVSFFGLNSEIAVYVIYSLKLVVITSADVEFFWRVNENCAIKQFMLADGLAYLCILIICLNPLRFVGILSAVVKGSPGSKVWHV